MQAGPAPGRTVLVASKSDRPRLIVSSRRGLHRRLRHRHSVRNGARIFKRFSLLIPCAVV